MTNGREHAQCGYAGQRHDSRPRWDGADVTGFHHTTHNSAQLKMYELLISAIFSFNIVRWRLTLGNKL